jgi:predicted nucleic acid-binding protein
VNVLSGAERRQRISANDAALFLELLGKLDFEVDHEAGRRAFSHLPRLCHQHALSSYDACYLDLALRRQLPLATLDLPLRRAASALDIPLLGLA